MIMETVYIIFQGDAWLSNASCEPLDDDVAYRTRKQAVERIIKEIIALRDEAKANKDDAIRQVRDLGHNQTQGMQTNFFIREFSLR